MATGRQTVRFLGNSFAPPFVPLRMRTVVLLALIGLVHAAQEPASSPDRELHWRQDLQALSAGLKAPGIRIAGGIATKGQKDFAQLYPHFDGDIWSIQNELPKLTDSEVLLRLMKLIASAHVGHNRIHLSRCEAIRNPVRQQQGRPENAEHARFSECR